MVLRVVMVLALCSVAVASPIIKLKTVNGQKRQYCCYGVVKPFDMSAKAKQGLRALTQAGFNLRKLRIVLDIHQKAVEGKLENVEKEAAELNKRVKKALQATMKILSDATKKAANTLSEVTEATNDLGKLGKDIQSTKTHDMITKIRQMIEDKPAKKKTDSKTLKNAKANGKKTVTNKKAGVAKAVDHKKPVNKKSHYEKSNKTTTARQHKPNATTSKINETTKHHQPKKHKTSDQRKPMEKKTDYDKPVKARKIKESREKDQTKSKTNKKSRHPKDIIPVISRTDKNMEAQRLLAKAEIQETEQVKRARDAIEKRAEDSKRAIDKAKNFLRQVEDGLLQVQNGFED